MLWSSNTEGFDDFSFRAKVKCGATIRLIHTSTKKFLHSHHFRSPLSQNQEVSAYAREDGDGDTGKQHMFSVTGDAVWPLGLRFPPRSRGCCLADR